MREYLIEKRLKEMCNNGHLTNDQNNFLLQEYYQDLKKGISPENSQAYALLILGNEKLLLHAIKTKFGAKSVFDEDMVSVGRIALIKAIDTFKTEKNIEFSSYATGYIRYSLMKYCRDLRKKQQMPDQQIFLEDYIHGNEGNEDRFKHITKLDTLSDNEDFTTSIQDKCVYEMVEKNLKYLSRYEALGIILTCGLFGYPRLTQTEISKKFNLSRQTTIKHIECGLKKLKVLITSDEDLTTKERILKQKILKDGVSNNLNIEEIKNRVK